MAMGRNICHQIQARVSLAFLRDLRDLRGETMGVVRGETMGVV